MADLVDRESLYSRWSCLCFDSYVADDARLPAAAADRQRSVRDLADEAAPEERREQLDVARWSRSNLQQRRVLVPGRLHVARLVADLVHGARLVAAAVQHAPLLP